MEVHRLGPETLVSLACKSESGPVTSVLREFPKELLHYVKHVKHTVTSVSREICPDQSGYIYFLTNYKQRRNGKY